MSMSGWLHNVSGVNIRQLLGQVPLLSLFSAAASTTSYHGDVGVLEFVNPRIGTYGLTPNGNGGMIPSIGMPFGMTRWTPQTRENFISQCPYHDADNYIHGFQATHQPAIWMGESGQVVLSPGVGQVEPLFTRRAHAFRKENEISTAYVYEVAFDARNVVAGANLTESVYSPVPGGEQDVPEDVAKGANGRSRRDVPPEPTVEAIQSGDEQAERPSEDVEGSIKVAMTATSHVGFMSVDFSNVDTATAEPYIFLQATRQNWTGHVHIDPETWEISGSNPQRQDYALGPSRAPGFRGYFVARFSHPFTSYGVAHGDELDADAINGEGEHLGAYAKFDQDVTTVEVRTGISFVSVEQARRNLDLEGPSTTTFDQAVENLKHSWLQKLGRVTISGVNTTDAAHDPRVIFYTSLFHSLQYPNDFSEPLTASPTGPRTLYSGYTDSVHRTNDSYYQSWSLWDTFRAEHSLLTLLAPERVNGMMRSLLQISDWSGRLPMWANIVETNIMIGTHVDAVLANALERGFRGFDVQKAWQAVRKNAFVPPDRDAELLYYDREGYTPDEARAGLTAYREMGYVPNDRWAESASRTLDYAFDDFAAAVVAAHAGDDDTAALLHRRASENYKTIYNPRTTFMEARNANGSFAGPDQGWTEGDAWIYTFAVPHDPHGLAELLGGKDALRRKLNEYFEGGHNEHSNEPSHHAPYLYVAAAGAPAGTQEWVRRIAWEGYNATAGGLSGNEDLGQMSAWYVFSALGFYPLNPASSEYVIGSPFFEHVRITFPPDAANGGACDARPGANDGEEAEHDGECEEHTLTISAPNAPTKPYVKGVKVDGVAISRPVLTHGQIVGARSIEFEMSDVPEEWGRGGV